MPLFAPDGRGLLVPLTVLALVLAGCGDGGSDGGPAAAVVVAPAAGAGVGMGTGTSAGSGTGTGTSTGTAYAPAPGDTWQIQLRGTPDTGYPVKVYDLDLFDTPASTIASLQAQGRRVICYYSAGSGESFRADYGRFAPADLGNKLAGYDDERWLDVRSANVRAIMLARMDLAVSKKCDGVDPDNVDGFDPANNAGFNFTAADQLDYNRFLATQAHARKLAVGLKNDVAQLDALAPAFDFAVNEQCHEYAECGAYQAFTVANKAVFNIEYAAKYQTAGAERTALCQAARQASLRTLVMPLALDGSARYSCD